jgi:dephospho-CoA kinase
MATVILITGPIASGKSTVTKTLAEAFAQEGARVLTLEADLIAKKNLYGPQGPLDELKAFFGKNVFEDGKGWNFPLISQTLFGDDTVYKNFQEIFGEGVKEALRQEVSTSAGSGSYDIVLVESANPLLLPYLKACFSVDCPADVRKARALARGKFADKDVDRIIAVQEKFSSKPPAGVPFHHVRNSGLVRNLKPLVAGMAKNWKYL